MVLLIVCGGTKLLLLVAVTAGGGERVVIVGGGERKRKGRCGNKKKGFQNQRWVEGRNEVTVRTTTTNNNHYDHFPFAFTVMYLSKRLLALTLLRPPLSQFAPFLFTTALCFYHKMVLF